MSSRLPSPLNTMVGAIELRGRLPGSTRLATGRPSRAGRKEKSVSSLLSRKPRTINCEPNAPSMVVVIDTALPSPSMIEIWLVPGRPRARSGANREPSRQGGLPAAAGVASVLLTATNCARPVK